MYSSTDIVFIRDLTVEMSAGIYDFEKAAKQRVIINIELEVESNKSKVLASIDDVVSYENIVIRVRELAARKHYDLLEELAEEVSKISLDDKRVLSAIVSIEKPDIFDDCASVGVKIKRC